MHKKGGNAMKIYVDHDGSKYEENQRFLQECLRHVKRKGDLWWDLCIGFIADLNTSCSALGKPVIQDPEAYILNGIESLID